MKSWLIISLLIEVTLLGCLDTNSGDSNVDAGSKYYLDGEYEKAEYELKVALDKKLFKYSRKETFTILGNIYNELEEYDSSIVYHTKAIELDSNYATAWVNLGIVYRLISEFELAEACYLRASEINPEDPELHASIGALYIFKDKPYKAIEHLERSIQIDPQLDLAHSNYALALAMIGEFRKADVELKKAVVLGYKNGETLKARIEELKKILE